MPLIITESNESTIEPLPEGDTLGICYAVYDLGRQKAVFKGEEKLKHKIMIMFETPEHRLDDDRVRVIKKKYTMTLSEMGNLRPDLKRWRGKDLTGDELKGFDIYSMIGQPAILEIEHDTYDGKLYAKIDRIKKVGKVVDIPDIENPQIAYSIADDGASIPGETPEWLVKIIMESEELSGGGGQFDEGKSGGKSEETVAGIIAKDWCVEALIHHPDIVNEAMEAVDCDTASVADDAWVDIQGLVEKSIE